MRQIEEPNCLLACARYVRSFLLRDFDNGLDLCTLSIHRGVCALSRAPLFETLAATLSLGFLVGGGVKREQWWKGSDGG
jgi:hypothetical protein